MTLRRYANRKRNEARQGAKWWGFSPIGKAKGENPDFDLRTVVLDSWTISSFFFVVALNVFSWILVLPFMRVFCASSIDFEYVPDL